MRSPADMGTIQIDITNACNKRCSNCTRFCGNHKKPFFMDYTTFKRAVDSLDGFEGVIGVMGGEPTLHPEFEKFVLYLQEKYGKRKETNRLIYPQKNFIREIRRRECESFIRSKLTTGANVYRSHGPGLWSNMSESYRKYYEIIQDTFNVQYLNDHINPSYHQPGLFSRKDLGITDENWVKMRDNCWIQNEWSATITPKGAFFCEIAGALDMLFDGPGGWKIEAEWWKRTPKEFGDQLQWCELCGFALDTFMRNAEDEQDDVSQTLYELLKKVDSPRMKAGKTNLVQIEDGVIKEECKANGLHFTEAQPYIEHYEDRFNKYNSILFANDYDTIYIADGDDFGIKLNKELKKGNEWKLLISKENVKPDIEKILFNYILNPGTLHCGEGFYLFSNRALSIKKYGFDRIARIKSFNEFVEIWIKDRKINISEIEEGTLLKRPKIKTGMRYVVWGAGMAGNYLADAVIGSGGKLVFIIDKDKNKQGQSLFGTEIVSPEILMEHTNDFDVLLIGHFSKFDEIKKEALCQGIPENKILLLHEV